MIETESKKPYGSEERAAAELELFVELKKLVDSPISDINLPGLS
jgi:hypothetical protein